MSPKDLRPDCVLAQRCTTPHAPRLCDAHTQGLEVVPLCPLIADYIELRPTTRSSWPAAIATPTCARATIVRRRHEHDHSPWWCRGRESARAGARVPRGLF